MPVVLILYDAQAEVAYWLYIQAYFESQPDFNLATVGSTVMVHMSTFNIVDEAAMRQFAPFRDAVLRQAQGVIRHDV